LRVARAEVAELAGILLIRLPEPEETDETAAEDDAACATGDLALPAARKLAAEGRWEDVALLYGERLQCSDPTYAVVLRDHYRAEKDWAKSDELRDELQAAGFEVRDTKLGTQVVPRG
jgi:cysteinyl-tRNA synthetase